MKHWAEELLNSIDSVDVGNRAQTLSDLARLVDIVREQSVYQFRSTELEAIADQLCECSDLEELARLIWRSAVSCGYQHFQMFVLKEGNSGLFKIRACTSFHNEWIDRYETKSYQFVDPVVVHSKDTNSYFSFSDLQFESPIVDSYWKDAKRYSVGRNGACFPICRKDGAKLGVAFYTENSASVSKELLRQNASDLHFISNLAAECFCDVATLSANEASTLSTEELQFLRVLATNSNPDSALLISPKYGSNRSLQVSIRSKMNVDTLFQAVALATLKGWFDDLPYHGGEVRSSFSELKTISTH